jgi:hypothetical protein
VKELYAALVKCQTQIKVALKDSKNPHFKSSYADLTSVMVACKDALAANNLAVLQLSRIHESGTPVLVTRIIHSSGEHVEGEFPLVCKDPNDPQKLGSAVTYARRYALAAALGITADDDDGQAASSHAAPPAPKAAPVQATGNVMAELFTKAGLKYPDALEEALGKSMKEWSEVEKTLARDAIKQLQGGKSWKLIAAGLERDKAFS